VCNRTQVLILESITENLINGMKFISKIQWQHFMKYSGRKVYFNRDLIDCRRAFGGGAASLVQQ
jgi:hypothetical protein